MGQERRQPYRIAIIGIGAVARRIAAALHCIPAADLVSASCRTESKGTSFAREYRCRWFDDTCAMLDEVRPDAAIICTPSGSHLEPAIACAERGIHILCEKPLEISFDRAARMCAAAAEAGVIIGGIFPQRFNPVNALVRDAALARRFGNIACISGTVPWWRDDDYYAPNRWQGTLAQDGGGALVNQGIHTVDLMQWIMSAAMPDLPPEENPVADVFACTSVRAHDPRHLEVEDSAAVLLRFRNGAIGQLLAATSMYPGSLRRLMVAGRDGTAEVLEDELLTYRFRETLADDESTRQRFDGCTTHGGGAGEPMAIDSIYHQRNIEAFLAALSDNSPPPITGLEACKSLAIIEACYESARDGRPVKPRSVNLATPQEA